MRRRGRSREMTERKYRLNKSNMPRDIYFGDGWIKAVVGTLS